MCLVRIQTKHVLGEFVSIYFEIRHLVEDTWS